MPFFNKFSAKKLPARKSPLFDNTKEIEEQCEFLRDDNSFSFCIGNNEFVFDNGEWLTESGTSGSNINESGSGEPKAGVLNGKKLHKELQTLQEENNLLKLKFDILVDTFAESLAESEDQQKRLNSKLKKKSK